MGMGEGAALQRDTSTVSGASDCVAEIRKGLVA